MLKYIAKRLLMLIPVMVGISLFIFLILNISPGDPARMILGLDASPEDIAALRERLGLDKPILVQYVNYIWNALHGDFGESWYLGTSVAADFFHRLPNTFYLAVFANTLSIVIGIPLGIVAAVRHNHTPDYMVTVCSLLLSSAPGFWLGMLAQVLFCIHLELLPPSGVGSFKHFILPAITMGGGIIASNMRSTRTWLLDSIRSDYVRTARAKGAGEFRVITHHALRNSMLPVVTGLGMNFAGCMAGTAVTEAVYAIPGIGSYMTTGVKTKDIPIVLCSVIIIALMVGVVNLIVDIIYAFIDPRVKLNS